MDKKNSDKMAVYILVKETEKWRDHQNTERYEHCSEQNSELGKHTTNPGLGDQGRISEEVHLS